MDPVRERYRYQSQHLRGDYIRAGVGLLLTLGPLFATSATGVSAIVLLVLAAVFAAFALRTLMRQHAEIICDAEGVSTTGLWRATVRWRGLQRVKLSYFSTRRDREKGWMQLMLRGDTGTIRVDSQLEGFEALVARAAAALNANGLRVNDVTASNFASYGHAVPTAGLLGDDDGDDEDGAEPTA